MTRKCVLCKETNYKNSFSFFSAPKDAETREKWQEAIGILDYVVNDETFVCSRHFTPGDIITHWVSGVPPHVVTIKYKKCRLRPGAIPSTTYKNSDVLQNTDDDDDDEFNDFESNRHWGNEKKSTKSRDKKKEVFLIPRTDNVITYTNIDVHDSMTANNSDNAELEDYMTDALATGLPEAEENNENDEQVLAENQGHRQDLQIVQDNIELDEAAVYLKASDDPSIIYVNQINLSNECGGDTSLMRIVNIKGGIDGFQSDSMQLSDDNAAIDSEGDNNINDGNDSQKHESSEMWEAINTNKGQVVCSNEKSRNICDDEDMPMESLDDYGESEDAMLFEDLLEVYTEVCLPRGWSSMVIPSGKETTIIYACMNVSEKDIPYVEKQVYLKNDLILKCSAAGKVIDPKLHDFFRDGRKLIVNKLDDIKDFIDEFHERVICQGVKNEMHPIDIDTSFINHHEEKMRHIDCSIIINNGSSRCSKCSTLNFQLNRRKMKKPPQTAESAELLKKDRTIYLLQKLLAKTSKRRNLTTFNSTKELPKSFSTMVSSLDIPRIQKLMIKECLKNGTVQNSNSVDSEFNDTWLFLSLLIYIESPRMYKFLHLNKYMNLPGIKIMRRYLHQIKTDDQFYKLFQRTVEPFQHNENCSNTVAVTTT